MREGGREGDQGGGQQSCWLVETRDCLLCVCGREENPPSRERVGVIPTRKCGRVIFFGITDLLFQWVGEGGVVTVLSVVGSRQRLREERGERRDPVLG